MHRERSYGPGFRKEFPLKGGKYRADAVKMKPGSDIAYIKELKPNNPRAIERGEKQLKKYAKQLKKEYPHINEIETEVITNNRPDCP